MTAFEYHMALNALGISGIEAAAFFGYSRQSHYGLWSQKGPPQPVAMMLKLMIALKLSPDDVLKKIK